MPQFTRFHVLYNEQMEPRQKYWQITARPSDDASFFEVRMFGGEVIEKDPNFKAENDDAEYSRHLTEESANKEADDERDHRLAAGWNLYRDGLQ